MKSNIIKEEFILFPGCMISYRLPFIEISIKRALNYFKINYSETKKFSCCPEPNGIKNSNRRLYQITAARNLAIAESEQKNILTPCNGCFETLKSVRSEISVNRHLRNRINRILERIGLSFLAEIDVYHLIEFFHKIDKSIILDNIRFPLKDLKVAIHYGCHFLRPSNKIQMDDPMKPHLFDELVEILGTKSIDYDLKMDCCGGSLARAGDAETALEMIHSKLASMKKNNIDAIIVGCPQCFIQFDHLQMELNKRDYDFNIPVLYYSELLCLALGIDIHDLLDKYHRTPVHSIYEKVKLTHYRNEVIENFFDVKFLKKCYECGACNHDCPVAKYLPTKFNPQNIVGKLLDGKLGEILEKSEIWLCLDCYICYELCPMKVGLVEIFTTLRNLSKQAGYEPIGFSKEFKNFQKSGLVSLFSKTARQKLGLTTDKPEISDLLNLFKIMEEEGRIN